MVEKKIEELKERIKKAVELGVKQKDPAAKQKCDAAIENLKEKCKPLIQQKVRLNALLNNQNQPPPIMKKTDCFKEKDKINEDIEPTEIKFTFKPSEAFRKANPGYIKCYFKQSDSAEEKKEHFDLKQESVEFRYKYQA